MIDLDLKSLYRDYNLYKLGIGDIPEDFKKLESLGELEKNTYIQTFGYTIEYKRGLDIIFEVSMIKVNNRQDYTIELYEYIKKLFDRDHDYIVELLKYKYLSREIDYLIIRDIIL